MSSDTNQNNRKTVRVGRRFAASIAVRLDAHPASPEGQKLQEERRIIALAKEVLAKKDPDQASMSFLTQAVELHTKLHGYSKRIYDELFRLHQERARRDTTGEQERERAEAVDSGKLDINRFLAGPVKV